MAKKRKKAEANHSTDFASAFLSNLFLYIRNYSEPHSQNRIFDASILLMWLPRHIKLLFCLNASIHRKQFCMALNSYIFFMPAVKFPLTQPQVLPSAHRYRL